MDFMHLGVRSRKVGINVKNDVERDEYSMENIDDFFDDGDNTTMPNVAKGSENLAAASQLRLDAQGFKVPTKPFRSTSRRSTQLPPYENSSLKNSIVEEEDYLQPGFDVDENVYSEPEQEQYDIPDHGSIASLKDHGTAPEMYTSRRRYLPSKNESIVSGFDDDNGRDIQQASILLTPEKSKKGYRDVPDLIADEVSDSDNSVIDTTLNTSDNALLEDELDDDYELMSEEDEDYIEGLNDKHGSVNESNSERDESDSDSSSENDSDNSDDENLPTTKHNIDPNLRDSEEEGVASDIDDEEVIKKQAIGMDLDKRDNNGLRRSSRVRVEPLDYWRNEKIVYKRDSTKPVLEIDKIIKYEPVDEDAAEAAEIARQKKKRKLLNPSRARPYNYVPTGKPRGRPRKIPTEASLRKNNPNRLVLDEIENGNVPHSQWLKNGILETSINVGDNEISKEIVAFAPNLSQSEQFKETDDEKFSLEIMFDKQKEHFASGMLKLPVAAKKKRSDSFNTYMTFYVVQGVLEVSLGDNKFIIVEGSSFQIPAFNEYAFENKGLNEAKMFFVQVTISDSINSDSNDLTDKKESEDIEDEFEIDELSNKSKERTQELFTNGNGFHSDMSLSEI